MILTKSTVVMYDECLDGGIGLEMGFICLIYDRSDAGRDCTWGNGVRLKNGIIAVILIISICYSNICTLQRIVTVSSQLA